MQDMVSKLQHASASPKSSHKFSGSVNVVSGGCGAPSQPQCSPESFAIPLALPSQIQLQFQQPSSQSQQSHRQAAYSGYASSGGASYSSSSGGSYGAPCGTPSSPAPCAGAGTSTLDISVELSSKFGNLRRTNHEKDYRRLNSDVKHLRLSDDRFSTGSVIEGESVDRE